MRSRAAVRALGGALIATVGALTVLATAGPAAARGGDVGGHGQVFLTSNNLESSADARAVWGYLDTPAYVGDWDGDGDDSFGARLRGVVTVRDEFAMDDAADATFAYGRPDDVLLVGDWDGDGTDTFAVRRGATYLIRDSLTSGPAERAVTYGRPEDQVLVGDWDGDGVDTLAVRRGTTVLARNTPGTGPAELSFAYGRSTDQVLVGDWDGDGRDTPAVRRGTTILLTNRLVGGTAERTVVYGRTTDAVVVGDWDGDGADSFGVRRDVDLFRIFRAGTIGVAMPPGLYRPRGTQDGCTVGIVTGAGPTRVDHGTASLPAGSVLEVPPGPGEVRTDCWLEEVASWAPVRPATTFGGGMFVVGVDVEPGTYRSEPSTEPCGWSTVSTFRWWTTTTPFVEIGYAAPGVSGEAVIRPGSPGFESGDGCRWTRVG